VVDAGEVDDGVDEDAVDPVDAVEPDSVDDEAGADDE
jgi:hypothetical protein